jgi:hypothetical protein
VCAAQQHAKFTAMRWASSCGVKDFVNPSLHYGFMFRIVAIIVVALAAFDFFFLDGTYLHHVQAMLAEMRHYMLHQ